MVGTDRQISVTDAEAVDCVLGRFPYHAPSSGGWLSDVGAYVVHRWTIARRFARYPIIAYDLGTWFQLEIKHNNNNNCRELLAVLLPHEGPVCEKTVLGEIELCGAIVLVKEKLGMRHG